MRPFCAPRLGSQKAYVRRKIRSAIKLGAKRIDPAARRFVRGCLKSPDSVIFHRLCFPIPASKHLGRTLVRVLICQDFSNILLESTYERGNGFSRPACVAGITWHIPRPGV